MTLPLDKQVTSLELSKRLKELGVPQESLFVHAAGHIWYRTSLDSTRDDGARISERMLESARDITSAYTVAELGEMLKGQHSGYYINQVGNTLYLRPVGSAEKIIYSVGSDTEANARAAMLVYLLENGLISNL